MIFDDNDLPDYYKSFSGNEWLTFSGKLSGSAQPGYHASGNNDNQLLYKLNKGYSIEDAGIDHELLSNLDALYHQDIHVIYNLIVPTEYDRLPELVKQIWESRYNNDTQYVTSINNVSIQIKDFHAPTQKQLQLITTDAIDKISNGKNILIHCHGGMGRTGTVLAAIYMKAYDEYDQSKAINYIRKNYHKNAVESESQIKALKQFGIYLESNH